MGSVRLTTAEALVRYLAAQRIRVGNREVPICGGVFAIFGHGNVAGLGAALAKSELPVLRGHNEQAMGLAATAFAKARRRRGFMAVTTSIGPGATNLVTAAATARVNRLPLLLLPGDSFASRFPDPVLQQLEHDQSPDVSVNDCLRPVSAFFDRIVRPEQLVMSIERAFQVLTDPVACGPVTIALPQDVQVEMLDVPSSFLEPRVWSYSPPERRSVRADEAADRIS
ncbi:MAG: 3D-(3,5/4)-trihydroxycyclohexane-1,2-dione acylhydrolase (decyclizing), partial [Myxococcales bacterium]|nr:3D-(3,5/4)-trihydroxycyclohexane-1,2-dione acylhydrolase (decyclizing) [Myxococcales bacterium]